MDADRNQGPLADERRFRALFERAYPALHRYAYHRGLARTDADDLVAEVLAIAWRRRDDVPADDPMPWLFAVARNVWRNHLRGVARRAALAARAHDRDTTYGPDESGPSFEVVRRALSALSDDDQEIIRLVAWDGLTPAQAAVALECTSAAARVRLHRARARFARHLGSTETRGVEPTVLHREPRPEGVPDEQTNSR